MILRRNHEHHSRSHLCRFHCRYRVRSSVRAAYADRPDPPGLGGPVGSGPGQPSRPSLGPGSGPGQPSLDSGSDPVRSGRSGLEGGLQGLKARLKIARRIGSIPVEILNH